MAATMRLWQALFARWTLPAVLWSPVTLLADLGIPAMLLAFGMSLHSTPLPRRLSRRAVAAIVTKAFLVPALALLVGLGLGLEGTPLRAAVVLAALPTAQVVFVHAVRYQVGIRLVQATTLWSMLLSIPVIVAAGTLLG